MTTATYPARARLLRVKARIARQRGLGPNDYALRDRLLAAAKAHEAERLAKRREMWIIEIKRHTVAGLGTRANGGVEPVSQRP